MLICEKIFEIGDVFRSPKTGTGIEITNIYAKVGYFDGTRSIAPLTYVICTIDGKTQAPMLINEFANTLGRFPGAAC